MKNFLKNLLIHATWIGWVWFMVWKGMEELCR